MKLYNLIQIKNIFAPHIQEKLSMGLSYKIFKLIKRIEEEESFFEQKRQEIINEFGEKDGAGQLAISAEGFVQIPPDRQTAAQKALDELAQLEVELPQIVFTIDELADIKFSIQEVALLEPLLKE